MEDSQWKSRAESSTLTLGAQTAGIKGTKMYKNAQNAENSWEKKCIKCIKATQWSTWFTLSRTCQPNGASHLLAFYYFSHFLLISFHFILDFFLCAVFYFNCCFFAVVVWKGWHRSPARRWPINHEITHFPLFQRLDNYTNFVKSLIGNQITF